MITPADITNGVTFTLSRDYAPSMAPRLHRRVNLLPAGATMINGGARGGDTLAALYMIAIGRGQDVYVVLPCTTDPDDLKWLWRVGGWERMPEGTSYKDRDTRMVDLGKRCEAYPRYPEWDHATRTGDPRSERSGTWMTARIAWKQGKPVWVVPLWGADEFEYTRAGK